MKIYQMKSLIIIYGLYLEKIQIRTTEERLRKILEDQSFVVNNDLTDLAIVVFKSSIFTDQSKRTHIIISLENEITEINYYTTIQ